MTNIETYSVTYVTTPNYDLAHDISQKLVKENLAACVNIIPKIKSIYKWKGIIQEDEEYFMIIKSKNSLFNEMSECIKNMHPYDTPEIISLPEINHKLTKIPGPRFKIN
ncbi:divalent-cation tolerance protein CutA-like isoform X2 [Gordionus sp. m RMFG-2023]|uniref:divalent-cation tolerance protein CutA-like isoform X2 n=1 Tax=Gordionus sp. m RMFG-2023 TaxID=3053472 RepID=UPI0031FDC955